MSKTIVIFTLNGCNHCQSLKKRLHENKIPFDEVEINSNKHLWEQVVQQTGHNVLPTVFIKEGKKDTGLVYVPGRDYSNEEEIYEIIQKHIN
jgi:glutaredoxin